MINVDFKYQENNTDFVFYKFQNLFSDHTISSIIKNNTYNFGLIEGKRTDKIKRLWLHQLNNNLFDQICKFFDEDGKDIFGDICNTSFSNCRTRIELCNDSKGSYLENHVDDPAKLFTLQVYLSDLDSSTVLANAETTAVKNCGWFFKNTGTEWHALKPLNCNRSSIIVNYVDHNWRDDSVLV
jgi:hypothetical protein